jgi:hypothetical protein
MRFVHSICRFYSIQTPQCSYKYNYNCLVILPERSRSITMLTSFALCIFAFCRQVNKPVHNKCQKPFFFSFFSNLSLMEVNRQTVPILLIWTKFSFVLSKKKKTCFLGCKFLVGSETAWTHTRGGFLNPIIPKRAFFH